jgi:hypothetical protein
MLTTEDLRGDAIEFVGNWRKFDDFMLFGKEPDPTQWGVFHMDSGPSDLVEVSNAHVIRRRLDAIDPDQDDHYFGKFDHWACGYVNVVFVRALDEHGETTAVWQTLHELVEAIKDYCVLDEHDLDEREWDDCIDVLVNYCDVPAMFAVDVLRRIVETEGQRPDEWRTGIIEECAAECGIRLPVR